MRPLKASVPNPALKPFEVFEGEWKTTGSHSYLPGTILHGRTSFEWLEGGVFLLMRSEIDEPRFPQRYTLTIEDNGNTLVSKGEMSEMVVLWREI